MVRVLSPAYKYTAAKAGRAWHAVENAPAAVKAKAKAAWPVIRTGAPIIAKAAAPVAIPLVGAVALGAIGYHYSVSVRRSVDDVRDVLNLCPFAFEAGTSAVTMGLAPDMVAQNADYINNFKLAQNEGRKYEGKRFNVKRLLGMTVVGALTGIALRVLYNFQKNNFPKTDLRDMMLKGAIDQFIWTPFIYMPAYFTSVNVIMGKTGRKIVEGVKQKIKEILPYNWLFWIPFLVAIYGVPRDLAVYVAQGLSLIWFSIMSRKSFGQKPHDQAAVKG
jgi:hypothetical protein